MRLASFHLSDKELDALWAVVATTANDVEACEALFPETEQRKAWNRAVRKIGDAWAAQIHGIRDAS